jgi:D-3-phosphoglycerate dehydrogenase
MKVLLTCPPMIGMISSLRSLLENNRIELTIPKMTQTLSEVELEDLLPDHDGWIIGDDPATRKVFSAGKKGRLRAAVKWGVGVDNVDFDACRDLGIFIENTPNMFGAEVADLAVGYVNALARDTFQIDRGVRSFEWPKLRGISMAGKTVALIGFGDIGSNVAKRLLAADMKIMAYDPFMNSNSKGLPVHFSQWPSKIEHADFIVITCSLTPSSSKMINSEIFKICKKNVRIVNVGRGGVVDEAALCDALNCGVVYSAALDVFEEEPLPAKSSLRSHPRCVFGSHNASNTEEAVKRTSEIAVSKLIGFLNAS